MIDGDLIQKLKGKVHSDEWTRLINSVDASHFQIIPSMVFVPEDVTDVINMCHYAYEREIPLKDYRNRGNKCVG
jgi:hypothetical protein